MATTAYVAVDMGASSGRHVLGRFDGRRIAIEEVHRFDNGPVEAGGGLYWDLLGQWTQIRAGLRAAAARTGGDVASIGVDTWGVDFGLLGRGDELLGTPRHYRDRRTDGMLDRAFAVVPRAEIFRATGVQFMPINTLYQLLALRATCPAMLDAAESLLMMPDLFNWLLTGVKCNELTDASTSQCFDPQAGGWCTDLLERFGLPTRCLGPIAVPGTPLGPLRPALAAESGLQAARVVLPGGHDTASAVVAVPARGTPGHRPDWCYLSLGTWALMGFEAPRPVVTDAALRLNFTNEAGVQGTTRVLKNITGLWLLQECRRVWNAAGAGLDWEALDRLAAAEPPLRSFIDPDAPDFAAPGDMPEAIRGFCRRTGQPLPATPGAVVRCALESLALKFRHVFAMCEELAGGRLDTIHVVGGGTRNRRLCQAAADACRRPVLAGPVEATAVGNLMMQAVAAGDVASLAEAREVVRASFPVEVYEPRDAAAWEEAAGRCTRILAATR